MRPLLACLALLFLTPAWGQRVSLGETSVQITPIAVITGQPGEDQMATIARAAALMDAYTSTHQVEVCGQVMSNPDDVFRIRIGTIGSHIACASDPTQDGGFTQSALHPLDIHSHPPGRTYLANAADVAINAVVDNRTATGVKVSVRLGQAVRVDTEGFSAQDFHHPGWLVLHGRLLYQGGPDMVHDLGAIADLTQASSALAQTP